MLRATRRARPLLRLLPGRRRGGAAAAAAAFSSAPPQITRKHVLLYDYVPDVVRQREPFRDAHIQHARAAKARGHLEQAGAFADPVDGAVFVFLGDDDDADADAAAAAVRAFADADPYVQNGLVSAWTVREWSVVGLD